MEVALSDRRRVRWLPGVAREAPDERLVAAVRDGDESAFAAIYDRHHGELLAFCRHMLGNREDAEDALQHVFVSAHRSLLRGGSDVRLRPWLFAIARNRCVSMLRARREAVALDDSPALADGLVVAAEVERREDLRDLLGDLARLPADQRAALLLAELGSLSHAEIAESLGVRRDKVKALVFQARESLMGWQEARLTDCREVRELLATVGGGAMRRSRVRRHVELCADCRAFREEVRRQHSALAAVLPVVPAVALRHQILSAAFGASGAAVPAAGGAAAAGGLAAAAAGGQSAAGVGGAIAAASSAGGLSLGGGLLVKGLAVAAIAGGAGGGGYAAVHELDSSHHASQPPAAVAPPGPTGGETPAVSGGAAPAAGNGIHRGPVQHQPGTPVRRGPVASSHGKGPGPKPIAGDRGNSGTHRQDASHRPGGTVPGTHGRAHQYSGKAHTDHRSSSTKRAHTKKPSAHRPLAQRHQPPPRHPHPVVPVQRPITSPGGDPAPTGTNTPAAPASGATSTTAVPVVPAPQGSGRIGGKLGTPHSPVPGQPK